MRYISPLRLAIIALALVGIGISGYLTSVHYAGRPIACGGLGSCETVNTSAYASVAGIPVALLGLGAYLVIAGLALTAGRVPWAAGALVFAALVGVLYSGYLTWVELAVLHAVCLWCAASAVVITAIAVLAVLSYLRGTEPESARVTPAPIPTQRAARR